MSARAHAPARAAAFLVLAMILGACGGGGGSSRPSSTSNPTPPAPVNQAPAAAFAVSTTDGFVPMPVDLDASASSDADGSIASYSWDFGDGSPVVTGAGVSHTFTDPGGYNVTLTVTDDDGATDTATRFVRARGATLTGTIRVLSTSAVDSDVNDRLTTPQPNDTPLTAQALANPVSLGGWVNLAGAGSTTGNFYAGGDTEDYFAVRLSGNEQIVLSIGDASADLDMELYEPGDLDNPVDAALGTQPTESLAAPGAGDFFIRVFAAADGSNYMLTVGQDLGITRSTPNRMSDAFVPGELLLAARSGGAGEDVRRDYALAHRGRLGRFIRARLGEGTWSRLGERFAGGAPALPAGLTGKRLLKYRTLLAAKGLARDPGIETVEVNALFSPDLEPVDDLYPLQWHYREIGLPAAWDLTTGTPTGPDAVIVAVVDTGILPGHPDFAGQLVPGYDFISDPQQARDGNGIDGNPTDTGDLAYGGSSSFHGTHVAGTVAARTDADTEGVAGVSWGAKIMPLRVLGVDGGTTYDVLQAVRWAAGLSTDAGVPPAARPADIINLSLGSPFFSQAAQNTLNEVRAAGVIVVASAGNESSSAPNYPAAYNGVVSVSATSIGGGLAPYSNFGAVDVAAPGGYNATDINGDGFGDGVLSTLGDDSSPGAVQLGYGILNGTSMAAPHVAGVAALMKAVHPGLIPAQFDAALAAGELTDDLGPPGFDQSYGHGRINAQKAVLAALAMAGGGGSDPGPVLASSLSSVNLGLLATSQTVTLSNLGTGAISIDQIVSSQPWLGITPVAVDGDGLGDYELAVDRSGLGEGSYNATARFVPLDPGTNAVTISVTLQVPGSSPDADAGLFYVIAVNTDGSTEGNAAVVVASAGEYAFTLNDIPAGTYQIFAGSDMDDDNYLCDAGEACGAYRTLDALESVSVAPSTAPTVTGIDFVSEFRTVLTTQAAVAPAFPPGAKKDGIPLGKPRPVEDDG